MTQPAFSRYQDPPQALAFLIQWNQQLLQLHQLTYQALELPTDWGQTVVWVHTPKRRVYQTLVFFAGFHTPALGWELTNSLAPLRANYRLCLVEINGQPGLSDGRSPALEGEPLGRWASQVLDRLKIRTASLIGQAMGAVVALKLCQVAPDRVQQAILINPDGFHALGLSFSLLRYYKLALLTPQPKTLRTFLRQAVYSDLDPPLGEQAEQLLIAFHEHALGAFSFSSWWSPPLSSQELGRVVPRVDLLLGARDCFFAYQSTLERAREHLPSLGSVTVVPRMGHGMQTSAQALLSLGAMLGYGGH